MTLAQLDILGAAHRRAQGGTDAPTGRPVERGTASDLIALARMQG